MKKTRLAFFVLFCLILVITSCGELEGTSPAQEIVTITLSKPKGLVGMDGLIRRFEAQNENVRVKVVDMPRPVEDRHGIYVAALSGKDDSVDLYWLEDIWMKEFASHRYLLPLNTYVQLQGYKYVGQAIEKFVYEDELYAMPIALDMGFLYYRKDLASKAPDSWDDILEMAKAGHIDVKYGIDIENNVSQDMIFNLLEMQAGMGGNLEKALNVYKEILDSNFQNKGTKNEFFVTFKSGDALFMRNWNFAYSGLGDELSVVRGKVGIAMLPSAGENKTSALLGGYGLGINANSRSVSQSVEFINFLTQDENQREMARNYGYMPVLTELYNDEMVLDANPHFAGLLEIIPDLQQRNLVDSYSDNPNDTKQLLTKYLNNKISAGETAELLNQMDKMNLN